MKTLGRVIFVIIVGIGASGCITHFIAADYPKYLSNQVGSSQLPKTNLQADYSMTPETESNRYEFRSWMAGYANLWVVEFGQILDQTLQSEEVQNAFRRLKWRSPDTNEASSNLLVFDLIRYEFNDFGAHVELKISLRSNGTELLSRTYKADGRTQGGKMFWGGVWAMKNAIQQSTKSALDDILRNLISDLNRQSFVDNAPTHFEPRSHRGSTPHTNHWPDRYPMPWMSVQSISPTPI
ncbi:MAG: hypothetical protein WA005_18405 [Candidatus Binataceae bacterium]